MKYILFLFVFFLSDVLYAEEPTTLEHPATVLAGFHKGNFFIRDAENRFRFSPKLRLQIDAIAAFLRKSRQPNQPFLYVEPDRKPPLVC